jgi:hypothetical protein
MFSSLLPTRVPPRPPPVKAQQGRQRVKRWSGTETKEGNSTATAVKRTKPPRSPFVDRAASLDIDDDTVIVDTFAVRQAKGI